MRARTITIVIGVAAAGVMVLGAQTATALPTYDTELTITQDSQPPGPVLIHGWVKSEVRKCEVERRVVLFRQRPGTDAKLGNTRTAGSSHYPWSGWGFKFHRAQAGWRVYAIVRHKVRDQFVCFADRSETYTVR